jgi:hypothetical protein
VIASVEEEIACSGSFVVALVGLCLHRVFSRLAYAVMAVAKMLAGFALEELQSGIHSDPVRTFYR